MNVESPKVAMRVDADVAPIFEKLRDRVKKEVAENISPDEPIRAVVRGSAGQAIVGTDRRAFVCKPGWMAGATLGAEVTTYNYLNVTGIQMHKGMTSGVVAVETGDQTTKTSIWKQGDKDPHKAPNAIPVQLEWNEVRAAVARLRQLVDSAHSPMTTSSQGASSVGNTSLADEIGKLADLRDKGVLTHEEFEAAKARLLAS